MGTVRSIDRRSEGRTSLDLVLTVWGVDTEGENFLEEVHARDISLSGALLVGVEADVRSGDVIGILYGGNNARYRVVWTRHDGINDRSVQVAIQRLSGDACPWLELLGNEPTLRNDLPPQTNGPSKTL